MPSQNTNIMNQLELSPSAYRGMLDQVVARIEAYLMALEDQPASYLDAPLPLNDERMPREPKALEELLEVLFNQVVQSGYNTTSPGFMGYFGGGGLPQAAIADLISGTLNRFVGRWSAAPEAVQIEANVITWLCEMVDYPAGASGVLTSGGSTSNLIAIFSARQHHLESTDLPRGRIYVSAESHFSLQKAAMICGLSSEGVVKIPCDDNGCMDSSALTRQIEQDRDRGLIPFLVVATGGTFGAGAVDDIDSIAQIADRESLWLHLDAAYGGFFLLTQRGRELLWAASKCDSITLDPHKSMFLPYGTGAILVRQRHALRHAHAIEADFYGPIQDDLDCIDFCSQALEQTRPWRGLRLWLPLKLHGIQVFEKHLEDKLDLAHQAAEFLHNLPNIQIVAEPTLSVLAFRMVLANLDEPALKRLNSELVDRINADKTIFLMGTNVNGTYALRLSFLSFRTDADRLARGLEVISHSVQELAESFFQLNNQ